MFDLETFVAAVCYLSSLVGMLGCCILIATEFDENGD